MTTIFKNFSFQLLTRNSVCMALEKLNVRKAFGSDSISPKILQLAASRIADSLTKPFNECIRKWEWPQAWKGEWHPVYKRDNRTEVRNYRLITLFSVVDKVFESMISSQVANYVDCMFNPYISSYRKKAQLRNYTFSSDRKLETSLGLQPIYWTAINKHERFSPSTADDQ